MAGVPRVSFAEFVSRAHTKLVTDYGAFSEIHMPTKPSKSDREAFEALDAFVGGRRGHPFVIMRDYKFQDDKDKELTQYQARTYQALISMLAESRIKGRTFVLLLVSDSTDRYRVNVENIAQGFLAARIDRDYSNRVVFGPYIVQKDNDLLHYVIYHMDPRKSGANQLSELGVQRSELEEVINASLDSKHRRRALQRTMGILPSREIKRLKTDYKMNKPTIYVNETTYYQTSAHTVNSGICPHCLLGRQDCIGHDAYGSQYAADGTFGTVEFTPLIANTVGNNPQSATVNRHPGDIDGGSINVTRVILYSLCLFKMRRDRRPIDTNFYDYSLVLHPVPNTPNPFSGINSSIQCAECRDLYQTIAFNNVKTIAGVRYENVLTMKPKVNKPGSPSMVISAYEWHHMIQKLTADDRLMLKRAGIDFMMHITRDYTPVLPSSFMKGDDAGKRDTLRTMTRSMLSQMGHTLNGPSRSREVGVAERKKKTKQESSMRALIRKNIEGKGGLVKQAGSIVVSSNHRATCIPTYGGKRLHVGKEEEIMLPANRNAYLEDLPIHFEEYNAQGDVAAVKLVDGTMIYAQSVKHQPSEERTVRVKTATSIINPGIESTKVVYQQDVISDVQPERRFKPIKKFKPLEVDRSSIIAIYRKVKTGDYCLMLRDPVIRKGAIVAMRVRVVDPEEMGTQNCIGVPPHYFAEVENGDYDGDQAPFIFLTSLEAQKALREFGVRQQLSIKNGTFIGLRFGQHELYVWSKNPGTLFRMWPVGKYDDDGFEHSEHRVDPERYRLRSNGNGTFTSDAYGEQEIDVLQTYAGQTRDYRENEETREYIDETWTMCDYIYGKDLLACFFPDNLPQYKYGESSTIKKKGTVGTYATEEEAEAAAWNEKTEVAYISQLDNGRWFALNTGDTHFIASDTKGSAKSVIGLMMKTMEAEVEPPGGRVDVLDAINEMTWLLLRFQDYNVEVGSIDLRDYYIDDARLPTPEEKAAVYRGNALPGEPDKAQNTFAYNPEYAPTGHTLKEHREHATFYRFHALLDQLKQLGDLGKTDIAYAYSSLTQTMYPDSLFQNNGYLTECVKYGSKLDADGIRAGLGAMGAIIVNTAAINMPTMKPLLTLSCKNIDSLAMYGFSCKSIWGGLYASDSKVAVAELIRALMSHALQTDTKGKICKTLAIILQDQRMWKNGHLSFVGVVM